MSDCKIDGNVDSGSQQQWISRNAAVGQLDRRELEHGLRRRRQPARADAGRARPTPTIDQTPIVREKPYLCVDAAGQYSVFVPSLRTNSSGITWRRGRRRARPSPSTSSTSPGRTRTPPPRINAALARASTCCSRPAIYSLNDTIRVTRADTVVLGLGFATLRPTTGLAAMTDRGRGRRHARRPALRRRAARTRPCCSRWARPAARPRHAANPISSTTSSSGSAAPRSARPTVSLRINSNDVDRRPLLDLARRPRRRAWAGPATPARQRPGRQRQQRHHLRPVRRALPGVPDALERQRRARLLLPVRDALRSAQPEQLDERRERERLGLVQGGRLGHQPRGLGPRHLQRLPQRRRQPDERHRVAHQRRTRFPRHGHGLDRLERRDQPHHQRRGRGGDTNVSNVPRLTSYP